MKNLYELTQEVDAVFRRELSRLGQAAVEHYRTQHNSYPSDPFVIPTWMLRTFIPIPSPWPPQQEFLVQYAYSGALRPGLRDGEIVGDVFAKAKICLVEQSFETVMLADSITEIGIQGVRPLSADEARIAEYRETVFDQLAQAVLKSETGIPPETRAYFELLKNTNGLIYEQIRKRHPRFFESVET